MISYLLHAGSQGRVSDEAQPGDGHRCHSIAGKGNPKNPLDDVGGKMTADEMKKYVADSKMKAFPNLPAEDLDALVAYLGTLIKKGS